jgi:hypothetical protein
MAERNCIILILAALAIREAWTLIPFSAHTFDPFPFYDIELNIQTYVYFLCHYVSMMVFAYAFTTLLISFRPILTTWFWLQAVEFIDYLLTYNSPWFYIFTLGIGITVTKFLVLSIISVRQLQWNKV